MFSRPSTGDTVWSFPCRGERGWWEQDVLVKPRWISYPGGLLAFHPVEGLASAPCPITTLLLFTLFPIRRVSAHLVCLLPQSFHRNSNLEQPTGRNGSKSNGLFNRFTEPTAAIAVP